MTERASPYLSRRYVRRLGRRRLRERGLRVLGILAIGLSAALLLLLFGSMAWQSRTAFWQTRIALPIDFSPEIYEETGLEGRDAIMAANHRRLVRDGLASLLGEPEGRRERRAMFALVSAHADFRVRDLVLDDPDLIGASRTVWVPASDDVDILIKGVTSRDVAESGRRLDDRQIAWIDALEAMEALEVVWNTDFFVQSASHDPEVAGILGAVIASFLTLSVTLVLTLPLGVGAAIYLEEFAPKNRVTEIIDVNIRNLAAIPSIVFGLLGLALFVELMGVPRSTPIIGGLVLALMTLPTIVIASRAALQAVPPSLYEASLQLGASKMQAVFLTVLPSALPGILTGTIIGMAQALGETAPLLMIGMVAFIADAPQGLTDPAAPLPVQIFLWATSAERAFVEKTAAAIVVLLAFLIAMNGITIYVRNRFERSW